MPKFANAIDLLDVAAAGAVPMLEFPPDYDMTQLAEQIRMLRQLDDLNRVLDMCKLPDDALSTDFLKFPETLAEVESVYEFFHAA